MDDFEKSLEDEIKDIHVGARSTDALVVKMYVGFSLLTRDLKNALGEIKQHGIILCGESGTNGVRGDVKELKRKFGEIENAKVNEENAKDKKVERRFRVSELLIMLVTGIGWIEVVKPIVSRIWRVVAGG